MKGYSEAIIFQVPRGSILLPTLAAEENMRNSVDAVPGLVVTEAPTGSNGSTQHVDGASLGTLIEGKPIQPALLKICPSHINVKVKIDINRQNFYDQSFMYYIKAANKQKLSL